MKNSRLVSLFIFLTVTLLGGGSSVTDEEFKVSFIAKYIVIHKFCHLNCGQRRSTQQYVDFFQRIDPIMANIIEQLKDEIKELKGDNEEIKVLKIKAFPIFLS